MTEKEKAKKIENFLESLGIEINFNENLTLKENHELLIDDHTIKTDSTPSIFSLVNADVYMRNVGCLIDIKIIYNCLYYENKTFHSQIEDVKTINITKNYRLDTLHGTEFKEIG